MALHKVPFEDRMKLYHEAHRLHQAGLGIHKIERELRMRHGYSVAATNISKWIYHGARPDTRAYVPNLNPSPQLSYFLGAFKGDGHDYYDPRRRIYRVGFRVKDKDFLRRASLAIAFVLRRKPIKLWTTKGQAGPEDKFHIFTVASWSLRKLVRGNLSGILGVAMEYPRHFLLGIFDAEGFVSVSRDGRRLRVYVGFGMSNRRLVEIVQRTLRMLGIESTGPYKKKGKLRMIQGRLAVFKRDTYVIHIASREGIERFAQTVGFTVKRKRITLTEAIGLIRRVGPEEALRIWEIRRFRKRPSI